MPAHVTAIDWLHRHGQIDDDRFIAGLVLEWLFRQSEAKPAAASLAVARAPRGWRREPLGRAHAVDHLAAIAEDLGSDLWPVLGLVVAQGYTLFRLETELGYPVRSGKIVVAIALGQLQRALDRRGFFRTPVVLEEPAHA